MDYYEHANPRLVENGVKYFLNETLKQCHKFKENLHNWLFNMTLFIIFTLILVIVLTYKYKGKLTPIEKQKKDREKQQYILTKIQKFQEAKKKAHQELITGLPKWDSDYDLVHNKIVY
jgi:membrane protein insertase Oxa1/YidC/SpoIIIJ